MLNLETYCVSGVKLLINWYTWSLARHCGGTQPSPL